MIADVITEIEQVTPAWLSGVFQARDILSGRTVVTAIRSVQSIKTNCTLFHLSIDYSDTDSLSAPIQLLLKIPNLDFGRANKEVEFYNVIVPAMRSLSVDVDWPFLHCYDAVFSAKTGQAHLLFEDLSATHFTTDNLMPPTQRYCEQVIDAYAFLHAYWWEHPRLGEDIGELLTDETIDGFLSSVQERFIELVNDRGEDLSKTEYSILESVASTWPAKRRGRIIQGKGVTLVHRDPHPGNFLYPDDEESATVKLIDWQSWRVDTGTDDIAYLMACHWPFEVRVQKELKLVKRYYERLVALGVKNYTWEDFWYDYKASVIRCLFFLIMAWSPKQWKRIKRGLEAFDYWGCADLF